MFNPQIETKNLSKFAAKTKTFGGGNYDFEIFDNYDFEFFDKVQDKIKPSKTDTQVHSFVFFLSVCIFCNIFDL
jgi:hypothetical protein